MMSKKTDHAEKAIRDIRRATRRQYSAEEKIRIVLEGLRGESSIAELCRKEGINQNLYYRWSKEFPEAGKKRLAGDTGNGNGGIFLDQRQDPDKDLVTTKYRCWRLRQTSSRRRFL
jgi:transposase-like protein